LSAASIVLLKSLLYRHGDLRLFADLALALPKLPDDAERIRFIKTVARRNTLLVTLRITPDTDVERLVNYWAGDWRAKDIRPLIESLRRVPSGASLDLAHLLPGFARRRLYAFPTPEIAGQGLQGSHWTALNLLSEVPDDRYNDDAVVTEALQKHYYLISGGYRLGDIVALMTPEGAAIHTAAYVADGMVFTRNGTKPTNPWQLMRITDLLESFAARTAADRPLKAEYFRARDRSAGGAF
jgi:hypothetical protein